ncbi:MAG: glycoside hydrolase family 18 protein [Treponema sp.]|nr:glycoside hydrolase family 18 protein [Treponema sp.]
MPENLETSHSKICATYIALWGVYDPLTKTDRAWTADDIQANLLTDLILSFAMLNNKTHVDLELQDFNNYKSQISQLAEKYPHLRISLAIGGASEGVKNFSIMSDNPLLRKTFVQNVENFLRENPKITGIDIDWEYPGTSSDPKTAQKEIENYINLLKELKEMMKQLGLENGTSYRLTSALPPERENLNQNITAIQEVLDAINLMTYDYSGAWSQETGHNAPLNKTRLALENLLQQGLNPQKVVFGIPFYGQRWNKIKENGNHGLNAPVRPNSQGFDNGIPYPKVVEYLQNKNFVRYWDSTASAPYLFSAKKKIFISYNDEESVRAICQLVNAYNLAGFMAWEYGQDMTGSLLKEMSGQLLQASD